MFPLLDSVFILRLTGYPPSFAWVSNLQQVEEGAQKGVQNADAFCIISHGRSSGNAQCKRLQKEQCMTLDKCLMLNVQLNVRSPSFTNQAQDIAEFCLIKQKVLFMCKKKSTHIFHLAKQVAMNN